VTETPHGGCRACGRTDVQLKKNDTLREHVHAKTKSSSFLWTRSRSCEGSWHPPKDVLGLYAKNVVEVLRREFKDLEDPLVAEVVGDAVQQQQVTPSQAFEVILDASMANWRLKWNGEALSRIRLACYKFNPSPGDHERAQKITELLVNLHGRKKPL
jgi:hypothetical protein